MAMVGTGNFPELLWPGIHDLFGHNYKRWDKLYPKVFEVKDSNKSFEKEQGLTGLPVAGVKAQGGNIPMADPQQGYQKEYVHTVYAIGSSVTKEMWSDDQYNYINMLPEMLAESMVEAEEITSWNHFNNGFSSSFTGADGVSLFNASHPLVGGGTLRNQPSTAGDLSQTTLETALIDISNWTDDQGIYKSFKGDTLVVSTSDQFRAAKILQSAQVSENADNAINPLRGVLKLLVVPYLTDTDAFFVTTKVRNGLVFYRRWKAELDRDNQFATKSLDFSADGRWSSGWTDWRGAYGNQGA